MKEVNVKTHRRKGKVVRAFRRTDKRTRKKNNILPVAGLVSILGVALVAKKVMKASNIKPNDKISTLAVYKPDNFDAIFSVPKNGQKRGQFFNRAFLRRTTLVGTLMASAKNPSKIKNITAEIANKVHIPESYKDTDRIIYSLNTQLERPTLNALFDPRTRELNRSVLHDVFNTIKKQSNFDFRNRSETDKILKNLSALDGIATNPDVLQRNTYNKISKLSVADRKLLLDNEYISLTEPYFQYEHLNNIKKQISFQYAYLGIKQKNFKAIEDAAQAQVDKYRKTGNILYMYKEGYLKENAATLSKLSEGDKQLDALKRIENTRKLMIGATTEGERSAGYDALNKQINKYKDRYKSDPMQDLNNQKIKDKDPSKKQVTVDLIKAGFSEQQLRYLGL